MKKKGKRRKVSNPGRSLPNKGTSHTQDLVRERPRDDRDKSKNKSESSRRSCQAQWKYFSSVFPHPTSRAGTYIRTEGTLHLPPWQAQCGIPQLNKIGPASIHHLIVLKSMMTSYIILIHSSTQPRLLSRSVPAPHHPPSRIRNNRLQGYTHTNTTHETHRHTPA